LQVAPHLGVDSFAGSNGWISKFKRIHNIVHRTVADESRSVDSETADDWKSN
jgi:hypothetical protein